MKVFVYFNLHKKCWSIKALDTGLVMAHASAFTIDGATFKVSEAGRQRVLKEQRKNVHAGIVGTLANYVPADQLPLVHTDTACDMPVTYNPYRAGTFVQANEGRAPVTTAQRVQAVGRTVLASI